MLVIIIVRLHRENSCEFGIVFKKIFKMFSRSQKNSDKHVKILISCENFKK